MSAALASGAGTGPPPGPKTWLTRPDLGLYVVTSPLSESPAAALVALQSIASLLEPLLAANSSPVLLEGAQLGSAVSAAEQQWQRELERDASLLGVGATLAVLCLQQGRALVAHLGDCRVYHIRGRSIVNTTCDHTLETAEGQCVVVRALGMESQPEVDTWANQTGDTFVLTAGVHEVLDDVDLLNHVLQGDAQHAASAILRSAVAHGGTDALSVVVVRGA